MDKMQYQIDMMNNVPDQHSDTTPVKLTDEQIAKSISLLNKLANNLSVLSAIIHNNDLTVTARYCALNVMGSDFKNLHDVLEFKRDSDDIISSYDKRISMMRDRIAFLESQIGSSINESPEILANVVQYRIAHADKKWSDRGFCGVTGEEINASCAGLTLTLSLQPGGFYPFEDRSQSSIKQLVDAGYQLRGSNQLKNTDSNRVLVEKTIQEVFPGCKITDLQIRYDVSSGGLSYMDRVKVIMSLNKFFQATQDAS